MTSKTPFQLSQPFRTPPHRMWQKDNSDPRPCTQRTRVIIYPYVVDSIRVFPYRCWKDHNSFPSKNLYLIIQLKDYVVIIQPNKKVCLKYPPQLLSFSIIILLHL